MAAIATSSTSSTLTKSGNAASVRPSVPITRVTIRDGKTIAINDHIYISAPWSPGAGEPYFVARVMEFVTAAASRKGGAVLASSSGTLQVRANIYLRQRDISHRAMHDPRLLVATMHSDVFALDNIRGTCVVRHRDLIGDAPAVSAWKKKDNRFYYHQLYDRYIHKWYDVIATDKVRNAPTDVLNVLRQRYSFIVAEPGLSVDLCGALRACGVCEQWAASAESVRCDTCKLFFHMACLSPPLAAKPAKGYSWTCAPCSKKREQTQGLPMTRAAAMDASMAIASHNADDAMARLPGNQGSLRVGPGTRGRGRGRGRGGVAGGRAMNRSNRLTTGSDDSAFSDQSREATPLPLGDRKTIDDERGTRCFNRWPYRYFGEHTLAYDVLDPHDSIYPRATARIGVKFQTSVITWEEQKDLGLGVNPRPIESAPDSSAGVSEDSSIKVKRPPGRPPKIKRSIESSGTSTPVLAVQTLPAVEGRPEAVATGPSSKASTPEQDVVRGEDSSVEVIWKPNMVPERMSEAYIRLCKNHFREHQHDIGLYNRALRLLSSHDGDAVLSLAEMTKSSDDELNIVHWSAKENKQFEKANAEFGAELKSLKRAIPTKIPAQIVRKLYAWKCDKLGEQWADERRNSSAVAAGADTNEKIDKATQAVTGEKVDNSTRAVSPSMSIWNDEEPSKGNIATTSGSNTLAGATKVCKMCATQQSPVWYKGPYSWHNRRLCVNCGIYWRKYAAETPSEITTRKRDAQDDALAVVASVTKVAKTSRSDSVKGSSATSTPPPAARTPAPATKFEPSKCVLCKKMEPRRRLVQCRQCSLSVHQGCFGVTDQEVADDVWFCDACSNERTLDAALVPHCILCPRPPPPPEPPAALVAPAAVSNGPRPVGRPRKIPLPSTAAQTSTVPVVPLGALDAFKPTECNNWTHLLCALYIGEIAFTDPEQMKIIEGAGNLPLWRYEAMCDVCKKHEGACVTCAEPTCKRAFHVSCACLQSGFTMGLDLTPVKSSRRDTVATATFKGETGHLSALVFCDNHRDTAKARKLLDLSDVDTSGQDSQQQATSGVALNNSNTTSSAHPTVAQVFARTHKSVRAGGSGGGSGNTFGTASYDASSYPLLRRAKRIDSVLASGLLMHPSLAASGGTYVPVHARRSVSSAFGNSSALLPRQNRMSLDKENAGRSNGLTADADDEERKEPLRHLNLMANGTGPDVDGEETQHQIRPHCVRCSTRFSPYWWSLPRDAKEIDTDDGADAWLVAVRQSDDARVDDDGAASKPARQPQLCARCRHSVLPAASI